MKYIKIKNYGICHIVFFVLIMHSNVNALGFFNWLAGNNNFTISKKPTLNKNTNNVVSIQNLFNDKILLKSKSPDAALYTSKDKGWVYKESFWKLDREDEVERLFEQVSFMPNKNIDYNNVKAFPLEVHSQYSIIITLNIVEGQSNAFIVNTSESNMLKEAIEQIKQNESIEKINHWKLLFKFNASNAFLNYLASSRSLNLNQEEFAKDPLSKLSALNLQWVHDNLLYADEFAQNIQLRAALYDVIRNIITVINQRTNEMIEQLKTDSPDTETLRKQFKDIKNWLFKKRENNKSEENHAALLTKALVDTMTTFEKIFNEKPELQQDREKKVRDLIKNLYSNFDTLPGLFAQSDQKKNILTLNKTIINQRSFSKVELLLESSDKLIKQAALSLIASAINIKDIRDFFKKINLANENQKELTELKEQIEKLKLTSENNFNQAKENYTKVQDKLNKAKNTLNSVEEKLTKDTEARFNELQEKLKASSNERISNQVSLNDDLLTIFESLLDSLEKTKSFSENTNVTGLADLIKTINNQLETITNKYEERKKTYDNHQPQKETIVDAQYTVKQLIQQLDLQYKYWYGYLLKWYNASTKEHRSNNAELKDIPAYAEILKNYSSELFDDTIMTNPLIFKENIKNCLEQLNNKVPSNNPENIGKKILEISKKDTIEAMSIEAEYDLVNIFTNSKEYTYASNSWFNSTPMKITLGKVDSGYVLIINKDNKLSLYKVATAKYISSKNINWINNPEPLKEAYKRKTNSPGTLKVRLYLDADRTAENYKKYADLIITIDKSLLTMLKLEGLENITGDSKLFKGKEFELKSNIQR
ncbi:MAG: hypothetical protein H6731_08505 [Myxococcales bacterium]|nr:MAG: hypothetical protein H6731_08505 [Myxococcales bacterium]